MVQSKRLVLVSQTAFVQAIDSLSDCGFVLKLHRQRRTKSDRSAERWGAKRA
jgi:hypothetical protein